MKEKGSEFFTLVINIVICVVCVISMVYAYKTAKTNDKKNVIYKNLNTSVEFSDGDTIEFLSNTKVNQVEKNFEVSNNGEDTVYIDFIWSSIDLNAPDGSYQFRIEGESVNKMSYAGNNTSVVPNTTSDGILMGETIMPGDTVKYKMTTSYVGPVGIDGSLTATIGVNIRH